jgi:LacI family transcriptional regulator
MVVATSDADGSTSVLVTVLLSGTCGGRHWESAFPHVMVTNVTRQPPTRNGRADAVDRHHVTLEDVAHRADVSLATASRVLNGDGTRPVGATLRERVLAAAEALHYTPNAHAQALAAGASTTVGLITHDVSDPYFAAIARGSMRVAADQGILVVLASTLRIPDRELAYVSALHAQRAKAILLIGSGFDDEAYVNRMRRELDAYADTGGRVAMVSQHDLPFDAVLPANREGASALAQALLDLGHRSGALITGPRALTTVAHRVEAFCDTFAAGGGAVAADQIVEADFSQDGGYTATLELLARGLTSTVLFCASDVMAIGALQALRERGIRVPEDLSVVGFDDIPIVRQLTPPLSTVALPMEEMGEQVMSMALGPPSAEPRVHVAPATVVLRGTTAPPPQTPRDRTPQ